MSDSLKKRGILSFSHFWWATWAICSHRSFLLSDLSDSLTSFCKKCLNTYKKLLKKVQTIQFYSKIFERITRFLWAKERMSNSLKKEQFAHSLFYHERPEQIANGCSFVVAHGCSFVLSDLSKSLTVAHLTSANWVNERMINQPYKSFTILPFLAFNSLRFFLLY